jgi:hypothetical protein
MHTATPDAWVPASAGAGADAEAVEGIILKILDIRKDIEKFQNGGPGKELVEAPRDQFVVCQRG